MSTGLPSYGRYVSRTTPAALALETAAQSFPFKFAFVTFDDDSTPVLVFNQSVYTFLAPQSARRLVDGNGATAVEAVDSDGEDPTRYLIVRGAASPEPVSVRAFEGDGSSSVDLLLGAQGDGRAVVISGDEGAILAADSESALRAIRVATESTTVVGALHLDRVPQSGNAVSNDGMFVDFRVLDANDSIGSNPLTIASITARVQNPRTTPSSSIDFALTADNVLTLNNDGAIVQGAVKLTKLIYDTSMAVADRAVGSVTALDETDSHVVTNSNVAANSIISITPRSLLEGATQWWVEIPSAGTFEVHFDAQLTANWLFDYEVKNVTP